LHDQLAKRIKSLPEATQLKIKDALGIIVAAMEIEGEEAAPLIAMNVPIEPLTPPSEG